MNKVRRKQEEKPVTPPAPTAEEKLLTEIRDLLSNNNQNCRTQSRPIPIKAILI